MYRCTECGTRLRDKLLRLTVFPSRLRPLFCLYPRTSTSFRKQTYLERRSLGFVLCSSVSSYDGRVRRDPGLARESLDLETLEG